jgi:hypothetical protein
MIEQSRKILTPSQDIPLRKRWWNSVVILLSTSIIIGILFLIPYPGIVLADSEIPVVSTISVVSTSAKIANPTPSASIPNSTPSGESESVFGVFLAVVLIAASLIALALEWGVAAVLAMLDWVFLVGGLLLHFFLGL